jgi:membrane protein required for colicin V production
MNEGLLASIALVDYVFAALMLILIIRCTLRGFIEEVGAMASFVLGVWAAVLFFDEGAAFIRTKILAEVAVVPEIMAFVALFVIVFVLVRLLEHILADIVTRVHLGQIDKLLGLFFGVVEGFALVALILFVLSVQPLFDAKPVLNDSIFARFLFPAIQEISGSIGFTGG